MPGRLVLRQLFFDASRGFGREVLAVREAALTCRGGEGPPDVVQRRLPMVSLGHKHMAAEDKAMALLHSIFCIAGPALKDLAAYLKSVRGMPQDIGMEACVGNAGNVLPAFFGAAPVEEESPWLPLLSLRVGGWNHCFHGVIERCVKEALPWYPSWLISAKHVGYIFRDTSCRDVVEMRLLLFGREDLCPLPHMPGFVPTRWRDVILVGASA